MAATAHPNLGRRLRLAVAGAAVVTALTVATAAAVAPTPMGDATAMEAARLGASPGQAPRASSPAPGFLLERGRFKPIAIPRGLEDLAPQGIAPFGINDRGQIVGEYADASGVPHGFLLDQRGRFTRIDVPGAKATNAAKINNRGQVVGAYSDTTTDLDANGVPRRGFLLDQHGRYLRLDFPGSVSSQALDINDRGQVSGDYQDADGVFHGYVWERGRFRSVDGPRAGGTGIAGINNRGQRTGTTGPIQIADAFVLDRGRFVTFRVPGAQLTVPLGINDQGQVVGAAVTAMTAAGFLRDPRGRLTAINRPGAIVTVASDINNRGQIVGFAVNPQDLASPPPANTAPMRRKAPTRP